MKQGSEETVCRRCLPTEMQTEMLFFEKPIPRRRILPVSSTVSLLSV